MDGSGTAETAPADATGAAVAIGSKMNVPLAPMVKLGLQYTAYFKFDGATTNYDGAGHNASNNNMLFAYLWFAY